MNEKDVVILEKTDFELLSVRKHDVQLQIIEKNGIHPNDLWASPQPYVGLLDWAKLVYDNKSGKYEKGYAEGQTEVTADKSWFWTHFLGDPVMAGTHGMDGYLQLGFVWGSFKGKFPGRCRALKGSFTFSGQILPTAKKIFYRVDIKRFLINKKTICFDGHISVDDPENVIYNFGETIGGWFSREELKIPNGSVLNYYNPNFEKCRKEMMECIERAEEYYKNLS